jgi:hypothetical protein
VIVEKNIYHTYKALEHMSSSYDNYLGGKLHYGFDKAVETINKAIDDTDPAKKLNIAILSLPYGGKSQLLEDIIYTHPSHTVRTNFSSVLKKRSDIPLPEKKEKIMIFDNCHYLYTRKIGGFDIIEDFLNRMLLQDNRICITTWNIHSWNYLDQVLNISKYFSLQIAIPSLEKDEMKDFLIPDNSDIEFINDTQKEDKKIIEISKRPVLEKITKSKFHFYSIHVDYSHLFSLLKRNKDESPESIILREITKLSYGNPGLAKKIWVKWLDNNKIKVSTTSNAYVNIDLDDTGQFILAQIMSYGHITKDEISDIISWDCSDNSTEIDKVLFQLSDMDFIVRDDDNYSIKPEKMYSVITYLKNIRQVW